MPDTPDTAETPVEVTYRVYTYYKRPKGQLGITSMDTIRINADRAIGWILSDFPEDSVKSDYDAAADVTTITIDWQKAGPGMSNPTIPPPRRR